ncbi:MAG: imidazole glycerol phosphate synthase subunit HisH [Opitutaceae bacterium]|nr:imidazole glycerol phosphate synthase subunit HisH [Opitutaceae bacterium]
MNPQSAVRDPQSSARPRLALVNYGMGNLRSVAKAFEVSGAEVRIVEQAVQIEGADGLVLPGVGALPDCVGALNASGLGEAVRRWIGEDRPFFGVCLGMQALFDSSEEGDCRGLGIFPGAVRRFRLPPELKVPHMGWNPVVFRQSGAALAAGMRPEGEPFYFVHSYHCVPADAALTFGECDYGGPFVAAIARGRCVATQFHPEKSQAAGLRLYRNFVGLCRPVHA